MNTLIPWLGFFGAWLRYASAYRARENPGMGSPIVIEAPPWELAGLVFSW